MYTVECAMWVWTLPDPSEWIEQELTLQVSGHYHILEAHQVETSYPTQQLHFGAAPWLGFWLSAVAGHDPLIFCRGQTGGVFLGLSQNHHFCVHYVFDVSSNPWDMALFFLLIILHWAGGGWLELLHGLPYFNTFQPTGQRTNLMVLPPTKNVHFSFSFNNQENDFPMGPL